MAEKEAGIQLVQLFLNKRLNLVPDPARVFVFSAQVHGTQRYRTYIFELKIQVFKLKMSHILDYRSIGGITPKVQYLTGRIYEPFLIDGNREAQRVASANVFVCQKLSGTLEAFGNFCIYSTVVTYKLRQRFADTDTHFLQFNPKIQNPIQKNKDTFTCFKHLLLWHKTMV